MARNLGVAIVAGVTERRRRGLQMRRAGREGDRIEEEEGCRHAVVSWA
jgi:hypothetical protein